MEVWYIAVNGNWIEKQGKVLNQYNVGILFYEEHTVYSGEWLNDMREGYGKL
jgi:hypothetical protein